MEIVIELDTVEEKAIGHVFEHEKNFLGEKSTTVNEYVEKLLKMIIRNKLVIIQQDKIGSKSISELVETLE